ncbi:MAG: winged helix-turn-helix domain-containing protein [Patescibacteria group bacterium]
MKTMTRSNIVAFVKQNGFVTPKTLIETLELTPAAVFRHLSALVRDGILQKHGTPPKVFYSFVSPVPISKTYTFDPEVGKCIQERFLKIATNGVVQTGVQEFIPWCHVRKLDPVKTSIEYCESLAKFDAYKHDGFIDATKKMQQTFPDTAFDKLFYIDFYSIERFGKTKLGELILYAKQSQNSMLIQRVVADVADSLTEILTRFEIDAVGFVPPTVKRNVQFMKELERRLHLPLPSLKITKLRTPITVPQKTLAKLYERIENARQSIVVEEERVYKNILLFENLFSFMKRNKNS